MTKFKDMTPVERVLLVATALLASGGAIVALSGLGDLRRSLKTRQQNTELAKLDEPVDPVTLRSSTFSISIPPELESAKNIDTVYQRLGISQSDDPAQHLFEITLTSKAAGRNAITSKIPVTAGNLEEAIAWLNGLETGAFAGKPSPWTTGIESGQVQTLMPSAEQQR